MNFAPVSWVLNPCYTGGSRPPLTRRAPGQRRSGHGRRLDDCGFEPDWLAEQLLERLEVTIGRPDLELSIAAGVHLKQHVLTAVAKLESGDRLGMAAVQTLCDPQD